MNDDLAGLRALVTGGASGIGLATARELSARGATVAVLDRELGQELPESLQGVRADLGDDEQVRRGVTDLVAQWGGLDLLVNNAAISALGGVEDNSDAEWTKVLDTNVVGLVRTTRAALPALRASAHVAIVNVTSIAALVGVEQRALYGASKGAVHALTLAMAADLIGAGIRVNAVSPGTADTPWVQRILERADDPEAARAGLVARQPHGRLVRPEEIAGAIAYLCSPNSGSTNGTVLHVDGGFQLIRRS